jgi:hypothetical protein
MNTKRAEGRTVLILGFEHIQQRDVRTLLLRADNRAPYDVVRPGLIQLDLREWSTMDHEHWRDPDRRSSLGVHLKDLGLTDEFVRCIGFCIRCSYLFVRFETGAGEHPDLPTFKGTDN